MAYYLQKPSLVDNDIIVYYTGDRRWTDDFSQKLILKTKTEADNLIANEDGKNGGWKNVSIISQ